MNLQTQKKAIAFVINSLEGGGAERVICTLLAIMQTSFLAHGYNVTLVLLDNTAEQQVCPDYVDKITLNSKGRFFASYIELKRWLDQYEPDLLVSFLTRSNLVCSTLGKQKGIPTIISERVNTTSHFANSRFGFVSRVLIRLFYPKADLVIPVSKGVMQDLIDNYRVSEKKCRILYNAYDEQKLNQLAAQPVEDLPAKPYIIGIGRLVENKNFALMIKAYAKSNTQRDLVILGQGSEFKNLGALAKQEGVEERVHLLGFRENPFPYLKRADYLISSSNAEGFPNGIAEAMCLGRPVIATNCESGPGEILTEDHHFETGHYEFALHGVICQTNNVKAMTDAIDALEKNDHLTRYAKRSLARAKAFSYQNMHNDFCGIVNRALSKKKGQINV